MRILILTDSMDTGGAETHIFTLAKELAARGHSVFAASGGGQTAERLRKLGVRHISLDLASVSPFSAAMAYIKLTALCRKVRIDVIHAHARMAALIGSAVAKKLRVPLVTTAHARFSLTPARTRFSRWGTLCAAVSEDLKHYVCESYKVSPDNVRVIENGIDTSLFSPRSKTGSPSLRLVFMSRMDTDCAKAARTLCSLAPRLCAAFPNLKITVAGGGDALEAVRALACGVSEESHISVLGHVPYPKKLLQSTDIFVGVSRAALEAMSCGVPTVIAGDEGFFGTVTKDNYAQASLSNFCARNCEPLTTDKLFNAVAELCSMNEYSRASLGRELRKEVLKTHRAELMAKKTLELYRDALKRVPSESGEIVLCGYYGCGNTGDDALLRGAVLRAKKSYPHYSVSALTASGRRDSERFGVRCVKRRSLAALLEIARAKIFVFGGGTLLQDTTSKRSLLYYVFLLRYAQRMGVRCELWGNGIGVLRVKYLRPLVSRAIRGCAYIGTRDVRSGIRARALTNNACVLPVLERDLAADTQASSDARTSFLLASVGIDENAPFAAVAVKGSRIEGLEKAELSRLLNVLRTLKRKGYALLFVEFFKKEDGRLTKTLAKRFGGKIAPALSASDMIGVFSRARLVCASRFHALVFARKANIPFLAFGTDPKIKAFN